MFASLRAGVIASKFGKAARYWQIEATSNFGGADLAQLAEVQLRAIVGGSTVTTASTPVSSSLPTNPTYPTSRLVDGSTSTYWSSSGAPSFPYTLTFDLGVPVAIAEVAICPRTAAAGYAPGTFAVKYSYDGGVFKTAKSFTESGWIGGTFKVFPL